MNDVREIQFLVGTEVDGFWGPKSEAACRTYLRSLMPSPNPWPKTDYDSLVRFYGKPGMDENLTLITPEIPLYFEDQRIRGIRCHKKVAESLQRCVQGAHAVAPAFIENYDGCFNFRRMRGGSSWSLHAWGAAVDFSAETNGNGVHWPTRADMPFSVMQVFAKEGWLSAGAFWSRDAMHFQATQ